MLKSCTCSCEAPTHHLGPVQVGSTYSTGPTYAPQCIPDGPIRVPRRSGCWLLITHKMGRITQWWKVRDLVERA